MSSEDTGVGHRPMPPIDFNYLSNEQLNPHDILCGKGAGNNNHNVNDKFRTLVQSRKDAYRRCNNKQKSAIANEIMEEVWYGMTPPGRFLKRASTEEASAWGIESSSDVWIPVDEVTARERVKQSLRQRSRRDKQLRKAEKEASTVEKVGQGVRAISNIEGARPSWKESEDGEPWVGSDIFINTSPNARMDRIGNLGFDQWRSRGESNGSSSISDGSGDSAAPPIPLQLPLHQWIHIEMEQNDMFSGTYLFKATQVGLALVRTALAGNMIPTESSEICVASSEAGIYEVDVISSSSSMANPSFSVGILLYEIYAGVPPLAVSPPPSRGDKKCASEPRKKRVVNGRAGKENFASLREIGLPSSVDALVMSLIRDSEGVTPPLEDVEEVLVKMVTNPDQYLLDMECPISEDGVLRLKFPVGKLYGRTDDLTTLNAICERVLFGSGSTEAVLLSGYSGTGKSSSIRQMKDPIESRGGFFLSGKFDVLQQAKPLSALVIALDSYIIDLISRTDGLVFAKIQADVSKAIGDDAVSFINLIPKLKYLIRDHHVKHQQSNQTADGWNPNAWNRRIFFFRKLLGAIANPAYPIVLFLDDLQWADKGSLEIINKIICDKSISSLLFVGSYRSNEVDGAPPLTNFLTELKSMDVPVHSIYLKNLSSGTINDLISDITALSPRLTHSLSEIVLQKTNGNCLFIVQFLMTLADHGFLRYSVVSRRWVWDEVAIHSMEVANNVADLMRANIIQMKSCDQSVLKVIALLGAQTNETTLRMLDRQQLFRGEHFGGEGHINNVLQTLESEGILIRTGLRCRFSHDQVQQAAYSLISEIDRPALHLQIGRALQGVAIEEELDEHLFTVVYQLNKGSDLILDHDEKVNLVNLNLRAGNKAISSSSFQLAFKYFKAGINLLGSSDWVENYDLCLELYSRSAETGYISGNYEDINLFIEEIKLRARTFDDKLRAQYTQMKCLGAQGEMKNAIKIGKELLDHLGESFEEDISSSSAKADLFDMLGMVRVRGKNVLSDRPMIDEKKIWATKILYTFWRYFYTGESADLRLSLVTTRMLRLTMSHGVCTQSAAIFTLFAALLCGFGMIEEAYEVGKIGRSLLHQHGSDRFNACSATCYASLYGWVNLWKEPLQSSLPELHRGYSLGLSTGEPQIGLFCKTLHILISFQGGRSLNSIVEDSQSLWGDFQQYQQSSFFAFGPAWQCSLNLMDMQAKDPTILRGAILDDDIETKYGENRSFMAYLTFFQVTLAFIFGQHEVVNEKLGKCRELMSTNSKGRIENVTFAFIEGLNALAIARRRSNDHTAAALLGAADASIAKMEVWSAACPWNCEHKLELLRAERLASCIASGSGADVAPATLAYDRSIRLAAERGFLQDEALAAELASSFHGRLCDGARSRHLLDRARSCYLKWGATRKAAALE